MGLLSDLDNEVADKSNMPAYKTGGQIVRPPFGYLGGKSASVHKLLEILPYRNGYVEPCGGSGAVLMSRRPSKFEVFNDAFAGVTAFYACLRDPQKLRKLMDFLEMTLHSREEFATFQRRWKGQKDTVERAGMWYAMHSFSFSQKGVSWGRSIKDTSIMSQKVRSRCRLFPHIHQRLRCVQIENRDIMTCVQEYDQPDHVQYIDPPYLDTDQGAYKNKFHYNRHKELCEWAMVADSYVAISGCANSSYEALYSKYKWDEIHEWEVYRNNGNEAGDNTFAVEKLWVKR
jgi:DNA adenine methylase